MSRIGSADIDKPRVVEKPQDERARRKEFVRELSDLLEKYEDIAECEGVLELDGGLWKVHQITKGR